jgi:hypothetical protein
MDDRPQQYGMDADAYERLPESVKKEMAEKREQQARQAMLYRERTKKRRLHAAVIATIASAVVALFASASPLCIALIAVTSGFWAWQIVEKKLGHLYGIVIFGANAIIIAFATMDIRQVGPVLFSTIVQSGIGAMVAKLSEDARGREDSF